MQDDNNEVRIGDRGGPWAGAFAESEFVPPDTTVRFDRWADCGVNVMRKTGHAVGDFVELAFVTARGHVVAHSLTLAQVEQLRAATDAVTRVEGPVGPDDYAPGELRHWVVGPEGGRPAEAESNTTAAA
jgi:hypothetical protein